MISKQVVRDIRKLHKQHPDYTYDEISKLFNIPKATVYRIISNQTYKDKNYYTAKTDNQIRREYINMRIEELETQIQKIVLELEILNKIR